MRAAVAILCTSSVLADVSICTKPDGSTAPCAPGNQECSQFGFGSDSPQFHVRDNSCGENDPNGPVYDPVHGVYHLHYQNHVGLHGGRTYGHAVSRDFVHWAHMPISIWNDQSYDSKAIYTGSATVVDGKVVQVYPGLCDAKSPDCPGGTNLCIAVPADPSDPLQTNWTKDFAANPVVAAIGRDPSTAWRTSHGEWRLTTFDTMIFGSMDFKTWYRIDSQPGFVRGECPSFFELPRTTPGAGKAPAGAATPTHVHKSSHGGKDWMNVGTYEEGSPKVLGNFSATPGVPHDEQLIDADALYASKDFYDPVKKRRINWGWARVPPASTQTLPREVTWHPELQQLVFSPVEEQASLRGSVLAHLGTTELTADKAVSLGVPGTRGNQSEIEVSFQRPSQAVRLSVTVMVAKPGGGSSFTIDYSPPMADETLSSVLVSGPGGKTQSLKLLTRDETLDMRLYVDNTFTEAFWMGGRVAMTSVTKQSSASEADVTVSANTSGVKLNSAKVWEVSSIWVTPEQVKSMPRGDADVTV